MKKKFDIREFNDFLLSSDSSVRDLGWLMVYSAIKIEYLSLDELAMLKVRMHDKRYTPNLSEKSWYNLFYTNGYRTLMLKMIEERLLTFDRNLIHSAFSNAKKIVKDEKRKVQSS